MIGLARGIVTRRTRRTDVRPARSQIKRQKGANDAKRGALFTKLTRDHRRYPRRWGDVDAKLPPADGGGQGACFEHAGRQHQTRRRAAGSGADAEQYEEITYEGFGPANVAVIVAAMTDNKMHRQRGAQHFHQGRWPPSRSPGNSPSRADHRPAQRQ
jgi:hypothetical protein